MDHLRKVGALDESAPGQKPRVIIANYVYGPDNCVASQRYSSVCCLSECSALMAEIEQYVQAPRASPEQLLDFVQKNLSSAYATAPTAPDGRRGGKALRDRQ